MGDSIEACPWELGLQRQEPFSDIPVTLEQPEMRAKGMKSLSFIIPQEANKPFVAPAAQGGLAGLAPTTKLPLQGRMSDREIDQQLVEKAQRGDK
ncbi:MAG TPA: hypothetical protein VHP55_03985, partial [Usitatibacter sp.]|nr:hypothetical protein [Usitatibacter sp.]